MKKDLNRILIETTIRGALDSFHSSPERETRNLVDMGLNFSKGRFQKRFMKIAQRMLQNTRSAYYTLVKETVSNVEQERLMSFSINIGYNSCTKGAKIIRKTEAERNFNIPWALNLAINEKKLEEEPDFYPSILQQSTELGIYTYLLFIEGNPLNEIPLLTCQPNCAFVLFLHGSQITEAFLNELKSIKNIMISVEAGKDMFTACQKLRDAQFLFAIHSKYTPENENDIISGTWLETVLSTHPTFTFLLADSACALQTQKKIYSYVLSIRDGQKYPLILMDVKQDMLLIDKVISNDVCIVGFGENGYLRTHNETRIEKEYNIFYNRLEDILQLATAK